jgi:hypothetical protein
MFLPALPPTSSCNLSLVCVRRLQDVMSNRVVQHMRTVQNSTTVSVKSVTLSFVPSKQRHNFRFMRAFAWWGRDIRNRARRHSQQEKRIHDVIRQFVVRREICSANHPLVPLNVTCFFERDENVTAADLRVHIPPQPVKWTAAYIFGRKECTRPLRNAGTFLPNYMASYPRRQIGVRAVWSR